MEKTYEFDDVLIRPIPSTVSSRDDVDISVKLSDHLTLDFPLIVSPMVGVVDGKFAKMMSDLGGLAILHRFYKNRESYLSDIVDNKLNFSATFGMSLKVDDPHFAEDLKFRPSIILVDTANGYTDRLARYCGKIKNEIVKRGYPTLLMAGNVVTWSGCTILWDNGCDIIRVGIGGGSPCSTRNQTGISIPTISALQECVSSNVHEKYKIVVDGGIKNSGDFVKGIVAGADFGMAGKLFAECYESPNEGLLSGMASRSHMENTKANIKSVEGFDTYITKKHSLAQFVSEFGYGIKSAGTYLNARSLDEIRANGEFVEVTDSAIKKGL